MGLFKKVALFTDIHLGLRNDTEQHNQDCLEFIEWFAKETISNSCDAIIFLGDWYHNRVRTENRTAHYSQIGIEILDGLGLPIYWILGNHEIYLKNSRDIHSLHYLTKYRNIRLIDHITKLDDVVFSPWLVGEEHTDLVNRSAKYVFGHFELPFFLMNQVIEKVYDGHGLHIDDFLHCEAVYSGHFHKRQIRKNKHGIPIYYIGNCFGHDMNDVNDPDRGMAILEWGELLPQYKVWPDAPTYHRYNISDFVSQMGEGKILYGPRSSIELIDDVGLPDDMMTELKSTIDARQVRIRKPKIAQINAEITEISQYNSLDQMVESKLLTMTYDGKFEPSLLVDLYRSV